MTRAGRAAKANLLPGLTLQVCMVLFLGTYLYHEGTRLLFSDVAALKQQSGYLFAIVSYILAASILPEIFRVVFFQGGRVTGRNLTNALSSAPLWGTLGLAVDAFYRLQSILFGAGNSWDVILPKVLLDQLVFSPFFGTPFIVLYLRWRDHRFQFSSLKTCFRWSYYLDAIFPVQVAGWCIWIPAVCLVYFMPPALQIPVAVLIQCFWALIVTSLSGPGTALATPPLRERP